MSAPEHHDELLFIIQHQTSELWMKLALHELRSAQERLAADDLQPALKQLARVKHIQQQLTQQWSGAGHPHPQRGRGVRDVLGNSSGFQSWQYRAVEFALGNKNAAMLKVFDHDPAAHQVLSEGAPRRRASTTSSSATSPGAASGVPTDGAQRDVTKAHTFNADLVQVFDWVYDNPDRRLVGGYEACKELVDVEENFPAVALPPPQDRRAHHRVQAGHRRLQRGPVPAQGAGPHVLPRAVRRAHGDRGVTTSPAAAADGQAAVRSRTWRLIRLSMATIPRSRSGDTASPSPNR